MKQLQFLRVTLCLMPTHCHCPGMGKNLCCSRITPNQSLQSSLSQPNITLISLGTLYCQSNCLPPWYHQYEVNWHNILQTFFNSAILATSSSIIGISPAFPKILTSLNMNHPIGIHVTNARGLPCMRELWLTELLGSILNRWPPIKRPSYRTLP